MEEKKLYGNMKQTYEQLTKNGQRVKILLAL